MLARLSLDGLSLRDALLGQTALVCVVKCVVNCVVNCVVKCLSLGDASQHIFTTHLTTHFYNSARASFGVWCCKMCCQMRCQMRCQMCFLELSLGVVGLSLGVVHRMCSLSVSWCSRRVAMSSQESVLSCSLTIECVLLL